MRNKARNLFLLSLAILCLSLAAFSVSAQTAEPAKFEPVDLKGHALQVFCGAGMTKPFQEIADAFEAATHCKMEITFGNAAQTQTQINTAKEGSLFIAGAAEELKPVQDAVVESKPLVKHIPVIAVPAGNPKKITSLADLGKSGVLTLTGDPESTPIGKIAVKAFADAGISDKATIIATTTTAPAMATALAAGEAHAAILWKENCKVKGVAIVDTKDMEKYIKIIPAATLKYAEDPEALRVFLSFLDSDEAKAIWQKYGYELVEPKK